MNILAIETSSDACSCALRTPAGVLEQHRIAPRQHTALLLPMVDALLAEAGLALAGIDRVAYGCGPGSFTGVRIAASVAQGLALAVDRPVIRISSLAAAALRGGQGSGARVIAAFDARLDEVYLGAYVFADGGVVRIEVADHLAMPQTATLPGGSDWIGVGAGWSVHGDTLRRRMGGRLVDVRPQVLPGAAQVALLAAAAAPDAAVPATAAAPDYLRRQVAEPRPASRTT